MTRHCATCGATEGEPHHDKSLPRNVRRRKVKLLSVGRTERTLLCPPCFEGLKAIDKLPG